MTGQTSKPAASKRLEERLVRYGAMALAAAAVSTAPPAEAAVIFHDGGGATTPVEGSVFFNMTTGAVSTTNTVSPHFELRNRLFGYTSLTFGPSSTTFSTFITSSRMARLYGLGNNQFGFPAGGTNLPAPFGNNVAIGPGMLFGQAGSTLIDSYSNGLWSNGQRAFLGLRFEISPGVARYGWADIQINEDLTISLGCFAYEDSGGAITTPGSSTYSCSGGSGVPEPSSVALMALGAAGLVLYRRRKKLAA